MLGVDFPCVFVSSLVSVPFGCARRVPSSRTVGLGRGPGQVDPHSSLNSLSDDDEDLEGETAGDGGHGRQAVHAKTTPVRARVQLLLAANHSRYFIAELLIRSFEWQSKSRTLRDAAATGGKQAQNKDGPDLLSTSPTHRKRMCCLRSCLLLPAGIWSHRSHVLAVALESKQSLAKFTTLRKRVRQRPSIPSNSLTFTAFRILVRRYRCRWL